MGFLNNKITKYILSFIITFSIGGVSFAEKKWSNAGKKDEWKEFIPKKGKVNLSSNKITGCGTPQNSFTILFDGTPELPICQIGVKEPYRKTKRDIDFSEYDIHGTMRTKCADALEKLPQDIFVPSPTKHNVWCPYIHPKSKELKVKNPNNFIKELKLLADSTGNSNHYKIKSIIKSTTSFDTKKTPWRKGFSGLYPNHATDKEPTYGKKERAIAKEIVMHQSSLITSYLFSDDKSYSDIVSKIEATLRIYTENNAFEYLFNTPLSQHIKKRSKDGGEGEMFDDYDAPGYWDNSATMGLNYFLPGIINLYAILKNERPELSGLADIRDYVQKLVWLNEQGLDYGMINEKFLPDSPESANHHSASRAYIHLLWGVADGDDNFFQAGVNHYLSVLQDSRKDGSIISEVKPSPNKKSTHGGWGSLDRNHETLGYHALSAMIIESQGYKAEEISINGVNLNTNISFGVSTFSEPGKATKWTKVKNHSQQYKEWGGKTTNKNLSWYFLSSKFLKNKMNDEIEKFIQASPKQWRAENLGLLDVRFFSPQVANKTSAIFDQLKCGYQILKRGFDKKKNKAYTYTVNFGNFTINGGEINFGKNFWKSGAVKLDKEYLQNNSLIYVKENGELAGTFPVFTTQAKVKTVDVEITATEGRNENSPVGRFLAVRENKTLKDDHYILQVNSCD